VATIQKMSEGMASGCTTNQKKPSMNPEDTHRGHADRTPIELPVNFVSVVDRSLARDLPDT